MIIQESVEALVTVSNQQQLTELKHALTQVGILVGGDKTSFVGPQRGEPDGSIPAGKRMKTQLVSPSRVADGLCPVQGLRRTSHLHVHVRVHKSSSILVHIWEASDHNNRTVVHQYIDNKLPLITH